MKPYICSQCGAPMSNPYKCEYCETVYQNDYNYCLDFEMLQAKQKIKDLQSQIMTDRLRLSQNMCGGILDFMPHGDVKDTICDMPIATPPPTPYSRFQWFKKIMAKIGEKDNDNEML